jgi:putative redox protein
MQHEITCRWDHDLVFEAKVQGHNIILDPGKGAEGPSPKRMLLASLAACTGADVVSILQKQRVEFDSLDIRVIGDVAEEHPKIYTRMKVIFEFTGQGLEAHRAKIDRAIALSEEKYCSVSMMLMKASTIDRELIIKER